MPLAVNLSGDSSDDSNSSSAPPYGPPLLAGRHKAKASKQKKGKAARNLAQFMGSGSSDSGQRVLDPNIFHNNPGRVFIENPQMAPDPNLLVQLEMIKVLRKLAKKRSDSSDSSGSDSSDGTRQKGSPLRAVLRLRKRVKRHPLRIVGKYREKSLARLGIQRLGSSGVLSSPFMHTMTSEKLRPTFGKMTGLWRVHHGISHILSLLEEQENEQAAATCVQLLKSIHQAVLDGGSWGLAATLLPWEDPLGREVFGGDENEMVAAAAWAKNIKDLQQQVSRLTTAAPSLEVPEVSDLLSKAEKKKLAAAKAKLRASPSAAAGAGASP